jgi:acyl-CoA thioester hydrolase
MEVARVDWCRAQGFDYREMERQDGAFLVVVEAHCRYLAPAFFDDEVVIETRLNDARTRLIRFEYRICHAAAGHELATGFTRHLICNAARKPVRLPEKYRPYFFA